MGDFWMDVRHGTRALAARRGFTIIAVFTLALGLGVTTAVTSVVYTVVVAPPPYAEPATLVQLARVRDGRTAVQLSAAEVPVIRASATTLQTLGVAAFRDIAIGGEGVPERVRGVVVTAATLRMLGIAPVAGRLPSDADDAPGGTCVAVLAHHVATARFDDARDAVGRDLRIDGGPCTVIAVMPRAFAFPAPYYAPGDLWLLAGPSGIDWSSAAGPGFLVFGRLSPGVSLQDARVELDAMSARAAAQLPELRGATYGVMRYAATSREASRRRLVTLLVAAALVLVIATVNVVNLQLGRSVERHAEMATRAALGASRGRLVRQLLAENLVLFVVAGGVGLVVASWSLHLIVGLRSFFIPRMEEAAIDGVAISVCFGLALLAGFAAGLQPALRASVPAPAPHLAASGRGGMARRGSRRFGSLLIGVETALALVLFVGAALLLVSYGRTAAIDPGFRTADVLHARVTPPAGRYDDAGRAIFFTRIEEQLAGVPGVLEVALADVPPGVGAGADQAFTVAGTAASPDAWPRAAWRSVSEDYFATLDIPVLRGGFANAGALPRAVVVNEQFARRFLADADPIGQRLHLVSPGAEGADADEWTVVGVVADAREEYIHRPPPPTIYARLRDRAPASAAILAHTAVAPLTLSEDVRRAISMLDADQPVYGLRDLRYMLASELDLNRLSMTLLALFAGVALVLAMAGVHGVVAHTVGRRLREIGLRMALGARGRDVLRLVVGECARSAGAGILAGLLFAALFAQRLARLAPGWIGLDAGLLAGGAVLVLVAALFSAYVPARRAAALDPLAALRHE